MECFGGQFAQSQQYNDHHRGFDPQKSSLYQLQLAIGRVKPDQNADNQGTGYHKQQPGQQPGQQPAGNAAQPPACIGRQLHRLGAGQQHAKRQGAQKSRLA